MFLRLSSVLTLPLTLAGASLLLACPQGQCIDDGFAGSQSLEACKEQASATATTTGESESASASVSVSVSATVTMGSMSESMSATATTTAGSATDSDSTTAGTETSGGVLWCKDVDKDGYGDPTECVPGTPGEDPPSGWVPGGEDCDDSDPNTFPGAAEKDDPDACMTDADDDGYGDSTPSGPGVTPGSDCADDDANTYPGAAENDDAEACMTDADGDGYGDSTPSGPGVAPGTDCDDADVNTFPGAAENESPTDCMKDEDGDGYGESMVPPGVTPGADCFDENADLSPGERLFFSVLEGGDVGSIDLGSGVVDPFVTLDIAGLEGEWSVLSATVSPEDLSVYAANAAQARLAIMDYCDGGMPSELLVHNRSICGIAFAATGELYGVDSNADELVTFDVATGSVADAKAITLDGVTVNIAACGMGFDCHSGNLLISDSLAKRVLSVDPATGEATVAATLDITPGPGLEYDPVTREILTNNGKILYQVAIDGSNTYSTVTTLSTSVNDLAFGPVCK